MHFVLVFSAVSLTFAAYALFSGHWGWLLLWPAISFLLVAAAYAGAGPVLFGKRPDGRLAWWALVLLGPYLLITWALWHLGRWLRPESPAHEVAPGIWVGRWPRAHELPPVRTIVDLTAEFPARPGIPDGRTYISLPTLDACIARTSALARVLDRLANSPGPVYIHCAAGHGRSAALAAALMIRRGLAADVDQAERLMQQVRPGIKLTRLQRRRIQELATRSPRA